MYIYIYINIIYVYIYIYIHTRTHTYIRRFISEDLLLANAQMITILKHNKMICYKHLRLEGYR